MACRPITDNQEKWTSQTKSLNPFFGKEHIYRYIESKGAQKHRDAGIRLFTSGHLQKLQFLEGSGAETVVRAEVLASMTTRTLYKASIKLYKCDGEVVSGSCTCVAGKGAVCKHICCVLYGLMYIAQHDLASVPDSLSCTETERQWYHPRDPRKVTEDFENVVFSKDTCDRISCAPERHQKRIQYSSLKADRKVMKTPSLINLHGNLKKCGLDCFADILEANDFLPVRIAETANCAEEDKAMPKRWLDAVKAGSAVQYTVNDVNAVENATRLQSGSPMWHHYRKGIMTASSVHRVYTWVNSTCKRKMGPHDVRSLLSTIMVKKVRATYAMKRGLLCKDSARKAFLEKNKQHVDIDVRQCGLFLCRSHPFLGASPDGIATCSCCAPRLLEIKSPMRIDAFCKNELRGGCLKASSRYFTQVQTQMGVTGLKSCVLFVYSEEKCVQVPVHFDEAFFTELVKCCKFFADQYLVPYFSGNWQLS
ncbi:uncharacterized protein LOC119394373 [Rhipicephalus sanguineus]|uniref:uncharacterized protein LOC119394373 n=1 Tax=Rhipicephalus sanguineus TaxID=34632 RepID=UPI0020C4B462|nr:uncharacterized protein LOC119394373 [Rhipicephalus sanguineus]